MNLDIDKERAAFSEWAKSENFNTNWHGVAKFFTSTDTQVRWEVWQAARATPIPAPAAPEGQAEAEEWMRKAIAETRTAASLLNPGEFRGGMETACDEIETRMARDAAPLPRQAAVQEAPSAPKPSPCYWPDCLCSMDTMVKGCGTRHTGASKEAALQQPVQAVPDPVLELITKHADRYLWLREEFATSAIPRVWQSNDSAEPVKCLLGEELDAAIDAEIGCGAAPGEPGQ